MIPIYIPTRGRLDRQSTWDNMGPEARESAVLVCPGDEVSGHEEQGRRCLNRGDLKGIHNARQFILDHALRAGHEKIIMLDDDLRFSRRSDPRATPELREATQQEIHELWGVLDSHLDWWAHAGVIGRQWQQVHLGHVKYGFRQNAIHAIRPGVLSDLGIRYDQMELMEDYHVTLKLFAAGYHNALVCDWNYDQAGGSNTSGGCSTYRDGEMQERASRQLEAEFPGLVKAVEKKAKTGWGGMETRWDVRIVWGRAAARGQGIKV
jgi:hypothetical protein